MIFASAVHLWAQFLKQTFFQRIGVTWSDINSWSRNFATATATCDRPKFCQSPIVDQVSGRTLWHTTTDPPNVGITETHGHLRAAHTWRHTATTTQLESELRDARRATDRNFVIWEQRTLLRRRTESESELRDSTFMSSFSQTRSWSRNFATRDRPKFCQSPIVDQVSLAFQKFFQNFFTSPILDQVSLACQ